MLIEKLKICDIKTIGLLVVNTVPPINDENLQLDIKRKIELLENEVISNIVVIVSKESEKDVEKKGFQIKYEVSATLNSSEKIESVESIQDDAVAAVFPYIRANVAALTSIACSSPITLPCLDMLQT